MKKAKKIKTSPFNLLMHDYNHHEINFSFQDLNYIKPFQLNSIQVYYVIIKVKLTWHFWYNCNYWHCIWNSDLWGEKLGFKTVYFPIHILESLKNLSFCHSFSIKTFQNVYFPIHDLTKTRLFPYTFREVLLNSPKCVF
jgi:hypothetical protein